MDTTWNGANFALLDRTNREGTVSVFLDYDLGRWTFGPRLEVDPCWFDFNFDIGPLSLSLIYWRRPMVGEYYADYSPIPDLSAGEAPGPSTLAASPSDDGIRTSASASRRGGPAPVNSQYGNDR